MKGQHGFAIILLMLILPLFFLILTGAAQLLVHFNFKNNFRQICIKESVGIINQIKNNSGNFNYDVKNKTEALLNKLQNINSVIKHEVKLKTIPKYEPMSELNKQFSLEFTLQYTLVTNFNLTCGASYNQKDAIWPYQIIYQTAAGKY
jgi:hypothetical protein